MRWGQRWRQLRAGYRGGAGRAVAQRTPLQDGPWTAEVGPPGGWDTGQGLAEDADPGHALSGTVGGIRMRHVGTLSLQRGPARPRPQGSSTGTHEPSRFHKAQERGAAGRAGAGRDRGRLAAPSADLSLGPEAALCGERPPGNLPRPRPTCPHP